jgi:hypothetical protein
MQFRFSSPFRFNLQQVNILGAYDRYEKELEDRKKEELYENKLVEQQVDDFTKYYNPKSVRENDLPLLQSSFKNYEVAAKQLNKARRIGNTDEINKNRESMQKAIADMGDVYNKSVIAKKVAADMAALKDQERKGLIVIDDNNYKNYFNLFTAGNLNDIENAEVNGAKLGKPDTWGNVMTGVEYTNNKHNEGLAKVITAFNSNKNNFIQGEKPLEYQTQKIDDKELRVPVFEKVPDYNKALQLASLQPEPMKKKVLNQFNTELAQGGAVSDIARVKQEKIARIFNKPADQLTANELLAYSISGDARKEADFKQGKEVFQMQQGERKQDFNEKMAKLRLDLAKAKESRNAAKEKEITTKQLNAILGYYKESRLKQVSEGGWATGQGTFIEKGGEASFKKWLDSNPLITEFINKNIPKTRGNTKEAFKALEGYMKNMPTLIANLNRGSE